LQIADLKTGADPQSAICNLKSAIAGRRFGGIDFGYRNPFAAVWGVLDRDGVLWLTGEHYETQKPLSYHVRFLPKDVRWYADPSGPAEIDELKCGGFAVSAGENALRLGIAAVACRLEYGTLKVLAGACPNLLREVRSMATATTPSTAVRKRRSMPTTTRWRRCGIWSPRSTRTSWRGW
jgi:hypothetical protein